MVFFKHILTKKGIAWIPQAEVNKELYGYRHTTDNSLGISDRHIFVKPPTRLFMLPIHENDIQIFV